MRYKPYLYDWWWRGAGVTVSSVASLSSQTTEQATVFSDLIEQLPNTVNVTLSNSNVVSMVVTWNQGSYNKDVAATYSLSGSLTLPAGVTNPQNKTASINLTVYWSPNADASKNIIWLNVANRYTMFQESNTNVPTTLVSSASDKIGMIRDRSNACLVVNASSDTRRPAFSIDGTSGIPLMNCTAGTCNLVVQNSKKFLAPLHNANPIWGLVIYLKRGTNGTASVLFSSDTGTSTNSGIYLGVNASDTLTFIVTKSGTTMVNVTTTDTWKVANGVIPIFIEMNGAGTNTGRIRIGGGSFKTFNITAGATADATQNLTIGSRDDSTSFCSDYIGDMIIRTGTFSSQDLTNFSNYVPANKNFRHAPVLSRWNDFSDTTTMWADAGRTVPITNNTEILYMDNKVTSLCGALNKDVTGTATTAPEYLTNQQNGIAAGFFDGVGDKLVLTTSTIKGGRATWVLIYKNTDATNGSNILDCFQAIAEANTSTTYLYGAEFDVIASGIGTRFLGSSQVNRNNTTNIHIIERDGTTLRITNGFFDTVTITNFTDAFVNSNIGVGVNANFNMDGIILQIKEYNGIFTPTDRNAIISSFNSIYNIGLSPAPATGPGNVYFYIVSGQSNEGLQTTTGHEPYGTIPANLAANLPYIRMYNGSGFTGSYTHPNGLNWGFQNQLMLNEQTRLNKPLFWFKYSNPATGLGPDGALFDQTTCKAQITNAYNILHNLYGSRLVPIFIWDMGVTDAAQLNNANAYPTELPQWWSDVRAIIGSNAMVFYTRLYSYSTQTYTSQIRTAQQNAQSSINIMLSTDLWASSDNQHYNATGNVTGGNDMSTAIATYYS